MLLTIVSFIVVMGVIVFVHELGHFLVAKRNKIVVEEFGFGYPPRVLKLFERDGTVYSLNAIPFGGFCRMRGEDDPSLPGSFASASKLARAATLVAGPAMNFLLAFILFAALALAQGVPDTSRPGAVVKAIVPGSPAETAGLQLGDRIVAVNKQTVASLQELQDLTKASLGALTTYTLVRVDPSTGAAQTIDLTMTPRANPPQGQGALGIAIEPTIRRAKVWEAAATGAQTIGQIVYMTFAIPANLIREGKPLSQAGFMGPVGIAVTTGEVVREARDSRAPGMLIYFMALLSTALGLTNLLPLPALDGGRLLFIIVEAIRGKRIEPAQEGMVHLIGFGLLLLLVGLLTVKEIGSLINGTFPSLGIR
jgi:regulator of sigma E protease